VTAQGSLRDQIRHEDDQSATNSTPLNPFGELAQPQPEPNHLPSWALFTTWIDTGPLAPAPLALAILILPILGRPFPLQNLRIPLSL
jgi:hypothetical protein